MVDNSYGAGRIPSMDYKGLIGQSWKYTQENKKLIIWLGFIPSLLTTTVGIGYIVYQFFAFKTSYLFSSGDDHGFLFDVVGYIWEFLKTHISITPFLIVFAAIFAILYFLFPTLAKAAAIQTIARNKNGQHGGVGMGLKYGIHAFLPLLEYHLLIKTFSFFSILIEMSFVLRNLPLGIFKILLPVFILFLLIGFVLTLLFTYTDFYIVVDDMGVFESMKASGKLVMTHWKYTFLITVLMIIIGIRIVIQVVMVFLIPIIIVLVTGYVATVTLPVTGVIVGGILGLVTLVVSSYLNGIVDVFSYSVWTFTFLELSNEEIVSARDKAPQVQEHNNKPEQE